MFQRILVVCIGNICRSPLAEARLRQAAPSLQVESAGIGALVGSPADPESQRIALAHGMDLSAHRGRQLTPEMCAAADLILVMEEVHVDAVCRISPSARGKVMLLGRFSGGRDIPDPYRKDASHFEAAYQQIDSYVQQWKDKLRWQ